MHLGIVLISLSLGYDECVVYFTSIVRKVTDNEFLLYSYYRDILTAKG